ncbi:MAG: transporter substrate-binding domain-containing protein [Spirochaetes bacterium]|nr:transporter substrate-binding domain-containing protein [Spirochaetota bacterium]
MMSFPIKLSKIIFILLIILPITMGCKKDKTQEIINKQNNQSQSLDDKNIMIFNTQNFPPFTYEEGQLPQGPAVKIIEAVCQEMGMEYKINIFPWSRSQMLTRTNKAHAMFLIGWNEERSEWLHFSHPIIETEYGFFLNKNSSMKYQNINDLEGWNIGVYGPSNTSHNLDLIKQEINSIQILINPKNETGFINLELERINAVYSNRDVGSILMKQMDLKNIYYAGMHKKLKYYIGFSKENVEIERVNQFNQAYFKLYQEGSIKKILTQYNLDIAVLE